MLDEDALLRTSLLDPWHNPIFDFTFFSSEISYLFNATGLLLNKISLSEGERFESFFIMLFASSWEFSLMRRLF